MKLLLIKQYTVGRGTGHLAAPALTARSSYHRTSLLPFFGLGTSTLGIIKRVGSLGTNGRVEPI